VVYWQTGHIDAIRPATILEQGLMSGKVILPVLVDPRYAVDIDNPSDWQRAEWLVQQGGLDMVIPGKRKRPLPASVKLLVMDFDGVLTDNRVWVDENGHEQIAAYRSDSMGLWEIRKQGVESLVISMETNPVVSARCKKMQVPVLQGINHKDEVLKQYLAEHGIDPADVVYMGNDINDLVCFAVAGCAAAPCDAEPEILRQADIILTRRGGHGAVREMCDLILQQHNQGV
jgi:N-acylneuraminate cytidylyltransferase